jgi:hypothetical protein
MKITNGDIKLINTLNKYPEIKKGVEELCQVAEADQHKPKLADDVEDIIVEDLNKLGRAVFTRWAECRAEEAGKELQTSTPVIKHGKKK